MNLFASVVAALLMCLVAPNFGQSANGQAAQTTSASVPKASKRHDRSAAGEYGRGAGDAGKGAATGAGNAAKGAGDFATLHPVKGSEAIGRSGKDVAVEGAKGTGRLVKGTGKLFKHPF